MIDFCDILFELSMCVFYKEVMYQKLVYIGCYG